MPASGDPVGFAVIGLGGISQKAVLPAFANAGSARPGARLTALVSGDAAKRHALADRYGVSRDATAHYDDLERCLARDDVEAVYIALPNHLHREYAVRAAEAGVHVLCEKPMAVTEAEARAMIEACRNRDVRLMVAYRLHFDPANLDVVAAVRDGRIGDPRVFSSTFTLQVGADDVRLLEPDRGGGPLYDIGIYCINAARYLFRAEPESVLALAAARPDDARFREVEESMGCVLRFPGDRIATFTCSFGVHPTSVFHLSGERGEVRLDNAFEYRGPRDRLLRTADGPDSTTFPPTDQFAPLLAHFAECIRNHRGPAPDGEEGLVDVAIIRALYRSIVAGAPVELELVRDRRPEPEQAMAFPAVDSPRVI